MATSTISIQSFIVGQIILFAGSTIPTGWLVCDGSAISRTTYSNLFSVLGTTWGTGDGSTTFNIPDFRGRTAIGVGESNATGHTNHALGTTDGEETHTLNVTEMPSHSHNVISNVDYWYGNRIALGSGSGAIFWKDYDSPTRTTGGDGAHNNMPPYATVNYIIFAGV